MFRHGLLGATTETLASIYLKSRWNLDFDFLVVPTESLVLSPALKPHDQRNKRVTALDWLTLNAHTHSGIVRAQFTFFHTQISIIHTQISIFHTQISIFHTQISIFHTQISIFHTQISILYSRISIFRMQISMFHTQVSIWCSRISIFPRRLVCSTHTSIVVFSTQRLVPDTHGLVYSTRIPHV
jgi:hypothetical protein